MKNLFVIAATCLAVSSLNVQAAPTPVSTHITYENPVDALGSILPYHESFELTGDSSPYYDYPVTSSNIWRYDWTIEQVGKSDNPATGPRKASHGQAYTYLDTLPGNAFTKGNKAIYTMGFAHNPVTYQTLYVEEALLTFDYHMFGQNIGKLAVEAKNHLGQWQRVWTKSGQQQSTSNQAWITETIDFSDTNIDKLTDVRFVAIAVGGSKGEIAIDNIIIDSAKRVNHTNFNYVELTQNTFQVNWDYVGDNYKRFIVGVNELGDKKWIHTYDSALQYDYDNLTWGQHVDKSTVCNAFGEGRWHISLQVWLGRDRNTASNISNITTWQCQ